MEAVDLWIGLRLGLWIWWKKYRCQPGVTARVRVRVLQVPNTFCNMEALRVQITSSIEASWVPITSMEVLLV